jgi:regulator of protease activity HflC (stomatin/prohibitin superfamily)
MEITTIAIPVAGIIILGTGALLSIKTVRQTQRGLIERFGQYNRFAGSGIQFVIPFVEHIYKINITERMASSGQQRIITKDNLNCIVSAQIYFKVRENEEGCKKSLYAVKDYKEQIVSLAITTLRNVIGTMSLREITNQRDAINEQLKTTITEQTDAWGIEIVRTELKEILIPKEVREAMRQISIAENQEIAAKNFAKVKETNADGEKMAAIKIAEGKAQAIKLVNEAAQKYFIGDAQVLRKLEATEKAIGNNAKIILPETNNMVNVIDSMSGITPIAIKETKKTEASK